MTQKGTNENRAIVVKKLYLQSVPKRIMPHVLQSHHKGTLYNLIYNSSVICLLCLLYQTSKPDDSKQAIINNKRTGYIYLLITNSITYLLLTRDHSLTTDTLKLRMYYIL